MANSLHTLLKVTLLLLANFVAVQSSFAHPMAPGLMRLDQQANGNFQVFWKTPLQKRSDEHLRPVYPPHCDIVGESSQSTEGTGALLSWQLQCKEPLIGSELGAEGFINGSPGMLLRLKFNDGRFYHVMLGPDQPRFVVPAVQSNSEIFLDYLELGVGHLLLGIDHVLFVILLFFLVGWNRNLFWTITLFTIGHSVTLALTVLGYVSFPVMLVESMIALSIVLAAVELLRNKPDTLFRLRPWLMSGGFGLLHGMGFAGVLSDIGLPQQEVPLALAAFNIGIEAGQLMVIGAMALLLLAYNPDRLRNSDAVRQARAKDLASLPPWATRSSAYVIGTIAACWFWQRLGVF